jgi:N-hydroxyarylamine O-acetyltransferase
MTAHPSDIDLAKYFARIDYPGPTEANLPTLRAVHLAHATHIPFENVDVLLGKPIRLDLPSLAKKLVDHRRGGYCFEQNTLLAAVLELLGFRVARLLARVHAEGRRLHPRTHMVLEVAADDRAWLADVGFGGWGLLEPIALEETESRQCAWDYRLVHDGAEWLLQARQDGRWRELYSFTREPQLPVDFEPANHYTSTHPDSGFVHTLCVQRPLPETRYVLRNRELTVVTAEATDTRTLDDDAELLHVLADRFNLELPPGPWMPPAAR